MRIARLSMDPSDKTTFEIVTKRDELHWRLKASHQTEGKRWFWALNNSIQYMNDEQRQQDRRQQQQYERYLEDDAASEPNDNEDN
jgi:hypothetical protein